MAPDATSYEVTEWNSDVAYTPGPPPSVVTYNGKTYVCTAPAPFISGNQFNPSNWTEQVPGDEAVPTSGRPAANSVEVGRPFYDVTLSKPIWSDGSVWRDAMGTAV